MSPKSILIFRISPSGTGRQAPFPYGPSVGMALAFIDRPTRISYVADFERSSEIRDLSQKSIDFLNQEEIWARQANCSKNFFWAISRRVARRVKCSSDLFMDLEYRLILALFQARLK